MKRGLGLAVTAALCTPATAAAQDLSRVTRGPVDAPAEAFTEMALSSADGRRAVFVSSEDTLGEGGTPGFNFYDRVGDVTTRLATFGGTGQRYHSPVFGASADASLVVFDSFGQWTADDTDAQEDVFAARNGVVTRVSQGPSGGNEIDFDARAVGMSGDGSRILFESGEHLTPDDTDHRTTDVFLRENGITTRVSTGNGQWDAELRGQSADASVLVIGTGERLTVDDTDDWYDLYVRAGGTTTKLSPGNGEHNVSRWLGGVSLDGRTVVFTTPEQLTPDDTDQRSDAYRVSDGTIARVSTGPLGGNDNGFAVGEDPDSGVHRGHVQHVSDDGRRVVFWTWERLTAADTNDVPDTYVWSPSGIEWVPGLPGGASADGSTVVTGSHSRLTADDLDDRSDLFVTRDGVTRKLTGDAPVDTPCWSIGSEYCAGFRAISEDGSRIFFETEEQLVAADTDDDHDVYQWAGGAITLLTPSRVAGADEDATFVDGALDGSIVYVESEEPLTADDTNTRLDAYRVHPPPAGEVPRVADGSPPGTAGPADGGAAGTGSQPAAVVRLLGAPRALSLVRGRTRLARSGRGLRFSLSRRALVLVTLERIVRGRRARPVVLRLRAPAGRHVLRLGRRLPDGRRLRPGRYRITLAATNADHVTVRLR